MKYNYKYTGKELTEALYDDFLDFHADGYRDMYIEEHNLTAEEINKLNDEVLFEKYGHVFGNLDKNQYYLTDGNLQDAYPVDADTPSMEDEDFKLFVSKLISPETTKIDNCDWEELYEYIMDYFLQETNKIKSLYDFTFKHFKVYKYDKDIVNLYQKNNTAKDTLELFTSYKSYNATMDFICYKINAFRININKYESKYILKIS